MASRILGIDPGSRCLGWGIVEAKGSQFTRIGSGIIKASGAALGPRLMFLAQGLREVVATFRPEQVAIERLFFAKNAQSVLTLAHARGVAMLVTQEAGLDLFEYTAGQIKQAVVGRGRAEKIQVAMMVRMLLKLETRGLSDLSKIRDFDETDALAAAMCHLQAADSLHLRNSKRSADQAAFLPAHIRLYDTPTLSERS